MKEIFAKINELYASFREDGEKQIVSGNKAAGMRSRTTSIEIEKLMKEYRKASLAESKK